MARAGCSTRRYYNTKLHNDFKNFILGGPPPRSLPICGILSTVENETLSTLYAFAGQAGPQGQRRRVLISNLGILPARHHGQSQEPRPAHRAGPPCARVDRVRAHGTCTSAHCLDVQITRLGHHCVYLPRKFHAHCTRSLYIFLVNDRFMYTFLSSSAKLCRCHRGSWRVWDSYVPTLTFGSFLASGTGHRPDGFWMNWKAFLHTSTLLS